MKEKSLYRSNKDRIVGGVSAGIAEYLDIETWIIRIVFVTLAIFGGSGLLIYVIFWIALPEKPFTIDPDVDDKIHENETTIKSKPEEKMENKKNQKNNGNLIAGVILIVLGALFLIERYIPRVDFADLWPILLITLGVILVVKANPQKKIEKKVEEPKAEKQEKTVFEEGSEEAFK